MQQFPPWPEPKDYCQAVDSWTVTVTTHSAQYNAECNNGILNPPACNLPPLNQTTTSTYSVWSGDHVFCLDRTAELWMLSLFLAGALWLLLTVVRLFATFDWRGLAGPSPLEIVKVVGGQVALLFVALCSFALLLLIHQSNFQLINSLLGGLPDWRVDSLWGKLNNLLAASETATQNLDPNAWTSGVFGGNLPDNTAPFGLTWGQIFGGLGSLESFLLSTLLPVRFTALFLSVVTAPLAIMAASLPVLRRYFWTWFSFWLEVEGLATFSALVLAGYQQLANPLTASAPAGNCAQNCGLAPTEQALILLSFAGIVCTANIAFMWLILGNFLSQITSIYQQQYQRERQFWGILAQAAVGVGGAVATLLTGGAALPFALAAEGVTSGIEELGAVPAAPVPGAGMGRTLLSAGGVATWRRMSGSAGGSAGSGPGGPVSAGGAPGGTGGVTVMPISSGGPSTGSSGTGLLPAPASGSPGSSGVAGPGAAGSASATPGLSFGPGATGRATSGQGSAYAPTSGAPASAFPDRATSGGYAGGSGAFTRLDPPWVPRVVDWQGGSPAGPAGPPPQSAGYRAASLQAAQALPNVLARMPLSERMQNFLFAPWHNARGEDIDAQATFQAYCYNAAHPDHPLQYNWNDKDFLRVETATGLRTGVPMDAIERKLHAVPYLRDALDLHRNDWLRPEELAPVAEALGTLYHALPRRDLYPERVNQIRAALHDHAALYAAQHDQSYQTLLRYITAHTPPRKGGQP